MFAIAMVMLCANGCSQSPDAQQALQPEPGAVLDSLTVPPGIADRILALDPSHLSDADVRDVLAKGPAPHIVNLQGSLVGATMEPMARFLIDMGYPSRQLRNPADGSFNYGSYAGSTPLAGMIAWWYEQEGMAPILIGHSQGGMMVMKVLHELAGDWHNEPAASVWIPSSTASSRSTTGSKPIASTATSAGAVNSLSGISLMTLPLGPRCQRTWTAFKAARPSPLL
jgi:hypothetical protein